MARGLSRLRDEMTGASAPGNSVRCWIEPATVVQAISGYGNGTDKILTVKWRDTEIVCAYLAAYETPAPGDVVALLVQPGSTPIVLDRIVGPPDDQNTGD